jgi:hypothetical protein
VTYLTDRDRLLKKLYDKADEFQLSEPDRELLKGMLRIAYAKGKSA